VKLRAPVAFDRIRIELDVPGAFPAEVEAEAAEAARRSLPDVADLRALELVTLDPQGSTDLDQAYALERTDGGFCVRYAIADVAHFVDPGGAVDREANRRGVTLYLPDGRAPLHPPVLSEGAASLLPDEDRPALVWTIEIGADGSDGPARIERAIVRSRRQLAYASADDDLLREVGQALESAEARRGGVSLDLPEQEVVRAGARWKLEVREILPIEGWNEQLSLLAGRSAARLMLAAGVGILRTMPPPDEVVVKHLRRLATALGITWPKAWSYSDVVRHIDRRDVCGVVFLRNAVRALRGAGYTAFDGAPPAIDEHSAVAAPYAHVTAPLRRLADRYANEVVVSLCAGLPVPDWARAALPELPDVMTAATRKEREVDRAVVDEVEALLLSPHVGAVLDATVVSVNKDATVAIADPVVVAPARAGPGWAPGDAVRVRVAGVDVDARRIDLQPA
jgi:exoribonuclease R